MLHIILFILKLIGIIVASILGILIFLLLLVLLVPIRYQIDAENKEVIHAEAKVSWLLRLLYFKIIFVDNHLMMKLYIFGKAFYDSDKPKKVVIKKVKRTVKRVEKQVEDQTNEVKIDTPQLEQKTEITDNNNEYKSEEKANNTKKLEIDLKTTDSDETNETNETDKTNEDKGFVEKIKSICNKIKILWLGIKNSILNIKKIFSRVGEIWNKLKRFLQNEINKAGLKHILKSLRKIFKHIRPTKLSIDMEFGTGDACSTGQALGAFAAFYGYYGERIKLIPNFETAIIEGTIFCKGRIRLFTLLIICIKLILDKNFRQLIKNFKAFKEEL